MAETPPYTEILRSIPKEKFLEVLSASARKSRETYFARHSIKAPKGPGFIKPGAKNEARAQALQNALIGHDDDELAEEILRVYLLSRRSMLGAALNHLKIEHQEGLTESDEVEKFESLKGRELSSLFSKLTDLASSDDISLYLKYMGTDPKEVDRVGHSLAS